MGQGLGPCVNVAQFVPESGQLAELTDRWRGDSGPDQPTQP